MAWVIKATRHKNQQTVIEIYYNITFIVKLLIAEKAFAKILDHKLGNNGKNTNSDLFKSRIIVLDIPLQKLYLSSTKQ